MKTKPAALSGHPQAVAFLRDITEHPDDDAPRLIFADWLDENGDADRAEFIRAQIERENLPPHSLRHRQLLAREKELLDRYGSTWLAPLSHLGSDHKFRRGFVERLTIRPAQLMHCAEQLLALAPLRALGLFDIPSPSAALKEIAEEPHLKRVRELKLAYSNLGDERLAELIGALESERLQELNLLGAGVGEHSLAALRTARLPKLRTLGLGSNPLAGLRLPHLFAGPLPFALRDLYLGDNGLGPQDIQALCDWPGLSGLESLGLSCNDFGSGWSWPSVSEALARLGRLLRRGSIRALHLIACGLGDEGIEALGVARLGALTCLNLGDNRIGPAGLRALLKRSGPRTLAELSMPRNSFGDEGVAVLASWPGLSAVAVLDLTQNDLTEEAFEALFDSPHLGQPVELNWRGNNPGERGVRRLAGCPNLGQLHALNLSACRLGDRRVEPLLTSTHLGNLHDLRLIDNPYRHDMKARLKARFPHGTI